MATNIVVTNAGRAALVNAQNTGTDPVTITQVGLSETAVVPAKTDTALADEFKRLAGVGGTVVSPDTIHIAAIDESTDAYSLRSLALYLGDGTLFGIYGQATPILEKAAASSTALSFDIIFADIDAALLSFGDTDFLLPQATTEARGTVELATPAEAQAGIDALRALTPANAKAAILGWLLSQDGAESGLDADLLDGQQGSYYANIPARLGFTPANKAGEAFAGNVTATNGSAAAGLRANGDLTSFRGNGQGAVYLGSETRYLWYDGANYNLPAASLYVNSSLAWTGANDGAGSGLDADLLDGQQGSYYTNIVGRLGFWPVQQGTGVGHLGNPVKIGWKSNGRLGLTIDNVDLGNFVLDANISDVWRSSNDGAGSGLDADLLDGQQGSYYSDIAARLGFWPANSAGQLFSGAIMRDSTYYMEMMPNVGPLLHFDSNDYITFNRGSNTLHLVIGGQTRMITGATGDLEFAATGFPRFNGSLIWTAGNDGSGSGLDADTVDGWHAGDLAKYGDFGRNLTPAGGHQDLPGGLRLQWGSVYVGSGNAGVALPAPFPNTCVFAGVAGGSGSTTQDNAPVVIAWNKDNITIRNAQSVGLNVAFFAIGW